MSENLKTEKFAVIFLVLLYIITALFVHAFPHTFEHPVVPDEKAYYEWARHYNEGKFAIPIEEWYDDFAVTEFYVNSSGVYTIKVNYTTQRAGERYSVAGKVYFADTGTIMRIRLTTISQAGREPKIIFEGNTSMNGDFSFSNLSKGNYNLEVHYLNDSVIPRIDLVYRELISVDTEPVYRFYLSILKSINVSGINEITVRNYDSFNSGVPDANISTKEKVDGKALRTSLFTRTDSEGYAKISVTENGNYILIAERKGVGNRVVNSVVEVNGKQYAVNHWPPGYSLILGAFLKLGIANGIGLFFMFVAVSSTYLLGRRLFSWQIGFYSAVIVLVTGIAIELVFEKGMADYATMALAVAGFMLLAEVMKYEIRDTKYEIRDTRYEIRDTKYEIRDTRYEIRDTRYEKNFQFSIFNFQFSIFSGLLIASAVIVRYSTIVVIFAAFAFFIYYLYTKTFSEKNKRTLIPSKNALIATLKIFIPFLIGLLLLGAWLANYNTTYFGGPFNSGYGSPTKPVVTTSSDENFTQTIFQQDESMFESYFSPSIESLNNLPNILKWLFFVMPVFFMFPLGVIYFRKNVYAWILLIYLLPVLIIYMQLSWVASWSDPTRAIEDTRYFLPALPPIAILTALGLVEVSHVEVSRVASRNVASRNVEYRIRPTTYELLPTVLLVLLIFSGFLSAFAGIGLQLERQKTMMTPEGSPPPIMPPPGNITNYTRTTINGLLTNPQIYEGKLFRVENVKIIFIKPPLIIQVVDNTTTRNITVHFDDLSDFPKNITLGNTINVQGIFQRGHTNPNGETDKEWEINIRKDTEDKVELQSLVFSIQRIALQKPDYKPFLDILTLVGVLNIVVIVLYYTRSVLYKWT